MPLSEEFLDTQDPIGGVKEGDLSEEEKKRKEEELRIAREKLINQGGLESIQLSEKDIETIQQEEGVQLPQEEEEEAILTEEDGESLFAEEQEEESPDNEAIIQELLKSSDDIEQALSGEVESGIEETKEVKPEEIKSAQKPVATIVKNNVDDTFGKSTYSLLKTTPNVEVKLKYEEFRDKFLSDDDKARKVFDTTEGAAFDTDEEKDVAYGEWLSLLRKEKPQKEGKNKEVEDLDVDSETQANNAHPNQISFNAKKWGITEERAAAIGQIVDLDKRSKALGDIALEIPGEREAAKKHVKRKRKEQDSLDVVVQKWINKRIEEGEKIGSLQASDSWEDNKANILTIPPILSSEEAGKKVIEGEEKNISRDVKKSSKRQLEDDLIRRMFEKRSENIHHDIFNLNLRSFEQKLVAGETMKVMESMEKTGLSIEEVSRIHKKEVVNTVVQDESSQEIYRDLFAEQEVMNNLFRDKDKMDFSVFRKRVEESRKKIAQINEQFYPNINEKIDELIEKQNQATTEEEIKRLDSEIKILEARKSIFISEKGGKEAGIKLGQTLAPNFIGDQQASMIGLMNVIETKHKDASPKEKFNLFYISYKNYVTRAFKERGWANDVTDEETGKKVTEIDVPFRQLRSMSILGLESLPFYGDFDETQIATSRYNKEGIRMWKTLNSLTPIFLMNQSGIDDDNFFSGFQEGMFGFLSPDVSGDFKDSGTEGALNTLEVIADLGIKSINEEALKSLEKGAVKADLFGGDHAVLGLDPTRAGETLGMLTGVMGEFAIGAALTETGIGAGAGVARVARTSTLAARFLGAGTKAEKLARLARMSITYNKIIGQAPSSFVREISFIKKVKDSKRFKDAFKSGIQFEGTGKIFKTNEEEFNFMSGFLGKAMGDVVFKGFQRMDIVARRVALVESLWSVLGERTPAFLQNMVKTGRKAGARGWGEMGEEITQEFYQAYKATPKGKRLYKELRERYPDWNSFAELAFTSYVMGAFFGHMEIFQEHMKDKRFANHKGLQDAIKTHSDAASVAVAGAVAKENARSQKEGIIRDIERDFKTGEELSQELTEDLKSESITEQEVDNAIDLDSSIDINDKNVSSVVDERIGEEKTERLKELKSKKSLGTTLEVEEIQEVEDIIREKQAIRESIFESEGKANFKSVRRNSKPKAGDRISALDESGKAINYDIVKVNKDGSFEVKVEGVESTLSKTLFEELKKSDSYGISRRTKGKPKAESKAKAEPVAETKTEEVAEATIETTEDSEIDNLTEEEVTAEILAINEQENITEEDQAKLKTLEDKFNKIQEEKVKPKKEKKKEEKKDTVKELKKAIELKKKKDRIAAIDKEIEKVKKEKATDTFKRNKIKELKQEKANLVAETEVVKDSQKGKIKKTGEKEYKGFDSEGNAVTVNNTSKGKWVLTDSQGNTSDFTSLNKAKQSIQDVSEEVKKIKAKKPAKPTTKKLTKKQREVSIAEKKQARALDQAKAERQKAVEEENSKLRRSLGFNIIKNKIKSLKEKIEAKKKEGAAAVKAEVNPKIISDQQAKLEKELEIEQKKLKDIEKKILSNEQEASRLDKLAESGFKDINKARKIASTTTSVIVGGAEWMPILARGIAKVVSSNVMQFLGKAFGITAKAVGKVIVAPFRAYDWTANKMGDFVYEVLYGKFGLTSAFGIPLAVKRNRARRMGLVAYKAYVQDKQRVKEEKAIEKARKRLKRDSAQTLVDPQTEKIYEETIKDVIKNAKTIKQAEKMLRNHSVMMMTLSDVQGNDNSNEYKVVAAALKRLSMEVAAKKDMAHVKEVMSHEANRDSERHIDILYGNMESLASSMDTRRNLRSLMKDAILKKIGDIGVGKLEDDHFVEEMNSNTTKEQRMAITLFVAGFTKVPDVMKNPESFGKNVKRVFHRDTITIVEQEMKNPTTAMKQHIEKLKKKFNDYHRSLVENGELTEETFIKNYVPQMWDLEGRKTLSKQEMLKFKEKNPNTKKRFIESYEKGMELGLRPKTLDAGELFKIYSKNFHTTAANKSFIESVYQMTTESGQKMVMLADSKAPKHYKPIDNPNFTKWAMRHDAKSGELSLQEVPLVVHESVEKLIKAVLEKPLVTSKSDIVSRGLWNFNRAVKRTWLTIGLFHHMALTESTLGTPTGMETALRLWHPRNIFNQYMTGKDPMKIFQDLELSKRAIRAGLVVEASPDIAREMSDNILGGLQKAMKDGSIKHLDGKWLSALAGMGVPSIVSPGSSTRVNFNPIKGFENVSKKWDAFLWDYLHNGMKLHAFESLVSDYASRNPKASIEKIAEVEKEFAMQVNQTFGGLPWELMGVSKRTLGWAQFALLSPDWTTSTFRQFLSPFAGFSDSKVFRNLTQSGKSKKNGATTMDKVYEGIASLDVSQGQMTNSQMRRAGVKFWVNGVVKYYAMMTMYNFVRTAIESKDDPEPPEDELGFIQQQMKKAGVSPDIYKGKFMHENEKENKFSIFMGRVKPPVGSGWNQYAVPGKQFMEVMHAIEDPARLINKAAPLPRFLATTIFPEAGFGNQGRSLGQAFLDISLPFSWQLSKSNEDWTPVTKSVKAFLPVREGLSSDKIKRKITEGLEDGESFNYFMEWKQEADKHPAGIDWQLEAINAILGFIGKEEKRMIKEDFGRSGRDTRGVSALVRAWETEEQADKLIKNKERIGELMDAILDINPSMESTFDLDRTE